MFFPLPQMMAIMNELAGFALVFGLLAVIMLLCLIAAIIEAKNNPHPPSGTSPTRRKKADKTLKK